MKDTFTRYSRKLFDFLGENNNSLYGAVTIAISKGILRPAFTMMDKKQDKKSRKYTAFREATTGAVALISYLATDKMVEKTAKYLAQKAASPEKLPQINATSKIISVSLTALFVIPYICNKITTPLMNKFAPEKTDKKTSLSMYQTAAPAFKSINYPDVYKRTINPGPFHYNGGLRIGG